MYDCRWRFITFKTLSHDPLLRIRFLLVTKIGSCEHIENDLPTHGSVILKKRMEIEHALFPSDTLLERWKAPTNFAWYPCDRFGAKLKIPCQFRKSDRVNTLQMTFRHSHHRNGTLKSDRLNACFQFSEPRAGSLKSDRVNGPLYKVLPLLKYSQNLSTDMRNAAASLHAQMHCVTTLRNFLKL